MILVTSPFNWYHAVTFTLTFDYFKVKFVAGRGTTILRICLFYIEIYVYLWGPYADQDMSAHQFYDFFFKVQPFPYLIMP